ncbi:MAG: hypothetical protein WAL29_11690 [Bacteroidales bacterium]
MKKVFLSLAMAFLSITFLPVQSAEVNKEKPAALAPAPKPADEAEARILISRLNEIDSMDKSKMNSSEKKNLRKEVKSIKSKLSDISGGIYISGAAIIVILVLLLILL